MRGGQSIVRVTFTARERFALDELVAQSGLRSHEEVIRLGLQHVARHYDIDRDLRLFEFRRGGGNR